MQGREEQPRKTDSRGSKRDSLYLEYFQREKRSEEREAKQSYLLSSETRKRIRDQKSGHAICTERPDMERYRVMRAIYILLGFSICLFILDYIEMIERKNMNLYTEGKLQMRMDKLNPSWMTLLPEIKTYHLTEMR